MQHDSSGVNETVDFSAPIFENCISRHRQDYTQLSSTPGEFDDLSAALGSMQGAQPNYAAADLAALRVPVTIVHSEHDEFIKR